MDELRKIQQELKVPKSQKNSFGNYKYRSQEDILEAVKPLLKNFNCSLTLTDDVVEVGGRVYVRATAMLKNKDGKEVHVTGYARETEEKKGMDASQITGAASSYARKYALNGLFCIDDNKDADTMDNSKSNQSQSNSLEAPVPLVCAACQKKITEAEKEYSIKHFGKTLCRDCQKVVKDNPAK